MNKTTIKQSFKQGIAYLFWCMFLWSIEMTDNEYWAEVYKLERNKKMY